MNFKKKLKIRFHFVLCQIFIHCNNIQTGKHVISKKTLSMKLIRYLLLFSVPALLYISKIQAQTNIGIRAITFNSHFGNDANQELYSRNIISNGILTLEPGLMFSLENFVNSKTSFQFSSAMLWDQVDKISGVSQILLKYQLLRSWKTTVSAGFGPAIHYRQSRSAIPEYLDEGIFTDNGTWQTKISWLSGEISLQYFLTKKTDFLLSLNHTQAKAIGISAGFRFWLGHTGRKNKDKGCNCPSFR